MKKAIQNKTPIIVELLPNRDVVYIGICIKDSYEVCILIGLNEDSQEYDGLIILRSQEIEEYRHLDNDELSKIKNVMQKVIPDAPHEILLILDASTGQNAIEQARQFTATTEVNALALTKLDGTAKGGVAIGISDQFQIPVKYIGLGEKMEDLQIFDRFDYVETLFK